MNHIKYKDWPTWVKYFSALRKSAPLSKVEILLWGLGLIFLIGELIDVFYTKSNLGWKKCLIVISVAVLCAGVLLTNYWIAKKSNWAESENRKVDKELIKSWTLGLFFGTIIFNWFYLFYKGFTAVN